MAHLPEDSRRFGWALEGVDKRVCRGSVGKAVFWRRRSNDYDVFDLRCWYSTVWTLSDHPVSSKVRSRLSVSSLFLSFFSSGFGAERLARGVWLGEVGKTGFGMKVLQDRCFDDYWFEDHSVFDSRAWVLKVCACWRLQLHLHFFSYALLAFLHLVFWENTLPVSGEWCWGGW
jgi:hypothetical protein